MKNKKIEIDALKKEIKAGKCNFWDAIFTLGSACPKGGLRKKLQQKLKIFDRETKVANSINWKFNYFDFLTRTSNNLLSKEFT